MVKDLSLELMKIAELLKASEKLEVVEDPVLPDELREAVAALQGQLMVEKELKPVEVLAIALLFAQEDRHYNTGDLLRSLFARTVRLRDQLRFLRRMFDRELLETIVPSIRIKRGYHSELVYHHNLTFLYNSVVHLSVHVIASIIGDEDYLNDFEGTAFENNAEFLESWQIIVEAMEIRRCNFNLYGDNLGSDIASVYFIKKQFDKIEHRLSLTTVEIPFTSFRSDFDLSYEEQLVVMYDVYHRNSSRYSCDLRNSAALLPLDSPGFTERDVFSVNSRLVRSNIYQRFTVNELGGAKPKYRLATIFYCHILGDLALKISEPLLE
jgi:hypothetical protein